MKNYGFPTKIELTTERVETLSHRSSVDLAHMRLNMQFADDVETSYYLTGNDVMLTVVGDLQIEELYPLTSWLNSIKPSDGKKTYEDIIKMYAQEKIDSHYNLTKIENFIS
tara:strand:- start:2369 stop:2701 length:333 start_codon:yes stop_codon:yes gene_type:complete